MTAHKSLANCELIVGNSNPRFSGVTSTMLQNLEYQQKMMNVRVLGSYHLSDQALVAGFWRAARELRHLNASGKWRVFHARRNDEMIQALLLKYLFGAKIKIVFTSTAQRHHSWLTRWLMKRMDAVLSTCKAAAAYLKEPPARIIAHGIQEDVFYPAENRQLMLKELGLKEGRAVGIFGRVRAQKGVHLFVRACIKVLPAHPDVSALIGGAISSQNKEWVDNLKKEIDDAGLAERIMFLGEQPFDRLPKLFRSMSVVAALSNTEGFGLTVLEAMSSGAAVLATEAGAWPEVVREGVDGYVVPVDDQFKITQALESMLAEPEKTEQMGRQGRERVLQHYTVAREAQELCDFFKTLQ